ncbi:MAG: carboxypeptidase-like regulatory domain-containing protein, partial [Bacteroidales bacterium]|nr:carboxypeptidase-like regulatory domain-containing protein [Bacteroidales bacterium]
MCAMVFAISTVAQVTTSSMGGRVSGDNGSLPGATVLVKHNPSGTTYGTTTNVDGRYTIQGMRVGGPYTITVSYVGYVSVKQEGITLKLGETYNANFKLQEEAVGLEEVTIMAETEKYVKNSASTTINTQEIQALPSISRSIEDVV